jgi:rhodanese-related sulfurtransferase
MTWRFAAALTFSAWFGLCAATALAQSGETPPVLSGAKTVTTDEVNALIGKVAILDVRRKASYVEGHIPGAKSIVGHFKPDSKTFDAAAFGADKSAAIVIHGHGSDGWSAVYAVNSAVAAGYRDVRWMRAGWAEWTSKKFPVQY